MSIFANATESAQALSLVPAHDEPEAEKQKSQADLLEQALSVPPESQEKQAVFSAKKFLQNYF